MIRCSEVNAMPGDTVELLQRFHDGDEAAYGALFERYRPDLEQFIGGHMDAPLRREVPPQDVLQETHLEALPPAQREAVLLRYVEGYDNAEAAAIAGIEPGAFRVRLARGLLRLREALAGLLDAPGPVTPGAEP